MTTRKKTLKKKKSAGVTATETARLVRRAVLCICDINDADAARGLLEDDGLTTAEARRIVNAAQKKIVQAAEVNRRNEIGLALKRLDQLYELAITNGDHKVALKSLTERTRILGLRDDPRDVAEQADEIVSAAEAEDARQHLAGLGLSTETVPLVELCRLAAQEIVALRNSKKS